MTPKLPATKPVYIPRPLASHAAPVLRKAFQSHGFSHSEILSRWPDIIGPKLAAMTRPKTIRWPRAGGKTAKTKRRQLGVLVLIVDGPASIELQHQKLQLLERINSYYGYPAIQDIKYIQGIIPTPRSKNPRKNLPESELTQTGENLPPLTNKRLKTALQRLRIAQLNQARPQQKF